MVRTPQPSPAKHWCFTSFKEYEHIHAALTRSPEDYDYCIFQTEVCPETERVHQQGFIMMKKPVRFTSIKKLLDDNAAHCEKRKGTVKQAIEYCKKDDSRQAGPFEYGEQPEDNSGQRTDLESLMTAIREGMTWEDIKTQFASAAIRYRATIKELIKEQAAITNKKPAPSKPLREWQQDLLDMINNTTADDRTVHWFVDTDGGCGKTYMSKYLRRNGIAFTFNDAFNNRDFSQNFKMAYEKANYKEPKAVVFDIRRGYLGADGVYNCLEAMNDGFLNIHKYDGGDIDVDPPHVIVFSNSEPKYENLSRDRWNVKFLKKNY